MQDIPLRESCVELIIDTMSYLEEKNRTRYSTEPVSSNTPLPNKSRNSGFESLADFEKKDLVSHSKMELEFKFEYLTTTTGLTDLILGLQTPYSYSPICLPPRIPHSQCLFSRLLVVRTRKVLPHQEPRHCWECASLGCANNSLAYHNASLYRHHHVLHEFHHTMHIYVRCWCCKQDLQRI